MTSHYGETSMRDKLAHQRAGCLEYRQDPRHRLNLSRTTTLLVITRPKWANHRSCAAWIAAELPSFKFDSRRNWWSAPLDLDIYHTIITKSYRPVNLTDGIKLWLKEEHNDDPQ